MFRLSIPRRTLFRGCLILLGSAVCLQAGMAHAAGNLAESVRALGFKPHKALYDIRLSGTKSGSQIVNIAGQMFYEWQPVCDAWTSDHRFNILYEYADSPPMRITSDFSTHETFDGTSFSFSSRRRRDGEVFEELRGYAAIDGDGTGTADYTMPEGVSFALPQGALFPMAHSIGMAEAIKAGKTFYSAVIFDGSDEEGPVEINTFIGKTVDGSSVLEDSPNLDKALLSSPAHEVRLAFFPLEKDTAAADYEMNLVFHDNGVISDMEIEYDDFTITQKLIAIEPLEDSCNALRIPEKTDDDGAKKG
ncbi:MAG: DUF1849 family protein [Alphaproteobacteria bacterium]|nr:DUF1849 family protein [Alphaproteobacteria bacterium]